MKIVFSLRFHYGQVNYMCKNKWKVFNQEDILRILMKISKVKTFQCQFDRKDRNFKVTAHIDPVSINVFTEQFRDHLWNVPYRMDRTDIDILEMRLEKGEIGKYQTLIVMEKLEGEK